MKQMKILLCNERFLFRFGVDRVLLLLGFYWKKAGHEIIMMGNKLDKLVADKCSDRFIQIPQAADYLHANDFTRNYLKEHWDEWFTTEDRPDLAFIAGWPFYRSIAFLREKCGYAVFQDHGAVPMDGMSASEKVIQKELRRLRKENLKQADQVIAVSRFIEDSQSIPDTEKSIPTDYVYNGVDHMDINIWEKDALDMDGNDVISDIRSLKKQGYRLIFQPGRWEAGNYKNSDAGFDIAKRIRKNGFKFKILVLCQKQDMKKIPHEVADCFYCMGNIDDFTMQTVMKYSDLGFSTSLWEGFDLPLGEMQFLNKHMYVFQAGAHAEVVADSFFCCQTNEEMSDKICQDLAGKIKISESVLSDAYAEFRRKFTWQKSADRILNILKNILVRSGVTLIDVTNACRDTANTGVMRVTRKLSRQMQQKAETVFVLWDNSSCRYVFPYNEEIRLLCSYGGADEKKIIYRSQDGCARAYLDDVWGQFGARRKVLLVTETMDYKNMRYIIPYMHQHKVAVAAVFYDAIPVLRADLCSSQIIENHKYYMAELASADAVIPIAAHNGLHLKKYWQEQRIADTSVRTVELAGEMDDAERNCKKISRMEKRHRILFVSTLEPRKNHKRFLEAFIHLMNDQPQLEKSVSLILVGNRYAGNDEIPEFVQSVCRKHSNKKWYGVVDDAKLRRLYRECTFTVYPSEIEGYGMPVMESLWFGKPCLCSDSGSIGELGAPGGCCLTDVFQTEAIRSSLYRMLTDEAYFMKLQHETVDREIVTWNTYAGGIVNVLEETLSQISEWKCDCLSNSLKMQIRQYLAEKNSDDCVIVCSNYYPPSFIGGAEIIAHSQSKVLANDKGVPVVVFSMDLSGTYSEGYCYLQHYDGLRIVRYCVSGCHMNPAGINFFHKGMNEAFRQLCELVRPTVVHGHNMIGMSLGMLEIAKKSGAAVCMTFHDHWGFCLKNTILDSDFQLCDHISQCETCMSALNADGINIPVRIRQAYFKRAFEQVDLFLSPSRYLADAYVRAGFSWHRMTQLWYGIDTKKYAKVRKKRADKFRISFVGYFGKHKGIDHLIRAVARAGRKNIEIELAGDGEESENYKKLAAELGILSQIRFWGKLDNKDMPRLFAETDVYCLPSVWPENQPVSITEAMACGIPVIASDLGGNSELVRHGVNGFLFRPGDDRDLSAKIRTLMDDESLLKSFGSAGKEIISRYDITNQAGRLLDIYRSIRKQTVRPEPFVSIKGYVLPVSLAEVTDERLLLLDWIVSREDYAAMKACVVLQGEKPDREQMEDLKKYNVRMIVPKAETGVWKENGFCVQGYEDRIHLLQLLAESVS